MTELEFFLACKAVQIKYTGVPLHEYFSALWTALDVEQWRDIPSCPGYQASTHGRIRSLSRTAARRSSADMRISERILNTAVDRIGYVTVQVCPGGKRKTTSVHRLVADAFCLRDSAEATEVNHRDGNKRNNRPENLEWVTRLSNMQHAAKAGLLPKGEQKHSAILNEAQVRQIREFLSQGQRVQDIADIFSMSPSAIQDIKQNRKWKHVR